MLLVGSSLGDTSAGGTDSETGGRTCPPAQAERIVASRITQTIWIRLRPRGTLTRKGGRSDAEKSGVLVMLSTKPLKKMT